MNSSPLAQEVSAHLQAKSLQPNPTWLHNFLSSQKSTIPLPALKQTAFFRIINGDVTGTLQSTPSSIFPADILNANIQERRIAGPVIVQVLDIEDIGRSRWSQVEALEADERGETTKGREIIRIVPGEEGETEQQKSSGPHKLLLQDAQGKRTYGIELSNIEGVGLSMNIGTKMALRDVIVARGVILLEPKSATVLGGKIEELHKKWKEARKAVLKASAACGRN